MVPIVIPYNQRVICATLQNDPKKLNSGPTVIPYNKRKICSILENDSQSQDSGFSFSTTYIV